MYPSFNLAAPPTPAIDELAIGGVRLESYYVHQLCSPTRTALLSSRFAYSIGMDDSVIVDGVDSDLELNLKTMARPEQNIATRSSRRVLLMSLVNPGSLYHCGKRT